MTCVISNRGTWGSYNRDNKHCRFYLGLNHGLNLGLKQRYYVYGTIKGSISNFRIMFFQSFSFLSRLRFPPCPPVRYHIGHIKELFFDETEPSTPKIVIQSHASVEDLLNANPHTSSTSTEDSYCGFGVKKAERKHLLHGLKAFRGLTERQKSSDSAEGIET